MKGSGIYYGVVVLACLVTTLINGAASFSFGIFFRPLETDFGWSRSALSVVSAISLMAYVPGAVILGRLADRYGPRGVLGLAALLIGGGLILNSQVHSLAFLTVNYALIGLGTGATFTLPSVIIQRWFVRWKGLMLGVVVAGSGIGGMVFAPLTGYLIELYGWRVTFLILGVVLGLLMAAAAAGAFPSPERRGLRPYGWEGGSGETVAHPPSSSPGLTAAQALRTRAFWGLLAIFVLTLSPNNFLSVHLVPLAIGRGISPGTAAAALGLLAGFNSGGKIGLGWLAEKIGWLRGVALAAFVCAAVVLGLIPIQDPALLYLFAAIYGAFTGGLIPPLIAATAQFFGTRSLAEILGYVIGAEVLLGALFSLLGGFIFDYTGSYLLALLLAFGCFASAGIYSLLIRPPKGSGIS